MKWCVSGKSGQIPSVRGKNYMCKREREIEKERMRDSVCLCMCVCMHACACEYMRVCMRTHACVSEWERVHTHLCMCECCMCACMRMQGHMCTRVSMHVWVRPFICVHVCLHVSAQMSTLYWPFNSCKLQRPLVILHSSDELLIHIQSWCGHLPAGPVLGCSNPHRLIIPCQASIVRSHQVALLSLWDAWIHTIRFDLLFLNIIFDFFPRLFFIPIAVAVSFYLYYYYYYYHYYWCCIICLYPSITIFHYECLGY